jgi:hypothetical protein
MSPADSPTIANLRGRLPAGFLIILMIVIICLILKVIISSQVTEQGTLVNHVKGRPEDTDKTSDIYMCCLSTQMSGVAKCFTVQVKLVALKQLVVQARLVALHDQDVVRFLVGDQMLGVVALGVQRVGP